VGSRLHSLLFNRSNDDSHAGYLRRQNAVDHVGHPPGLDPVTNSLSLLRLHPPPTAERGATIAIGFVDDANILTFSRSTEANCWVLERANEKCMAWARTHGATFAPEKYQLIHFTRKPKKCDVQATVRIPKFQDGPVFVPLAFCDFARKNYPIIPCK
jgi:hypothetical protein